MLGFGVKRKKPVLTSLKQRYFALSGVNLNLLTTESEYYIYGEK